MTRPIDMVHEELHAAFALLATGRFQPQTIAPHLVEAARLLRDPEREGISLPPDCEAAVGSLGGTGLNPAAMAELARALRQLARGSRSTKPRGRAVTWAIRAASVIAIAIAGALLLRPATYTDPGGAWRGAYYANWRFKGTPRIRHDVNLSFDWGEREPLIGMPRNHFGIRWTTCLVLEQPAAIDWALEADNEAVLIVGDASVIETAAGQRSGHTTLAPGAHRVRVDYVERRGPARISLEASVDGEPSAALPQRLLRRPSASSADPCAGHRD